jgi:REP element-mobilizing transposase RayT
MPYRRIEYHEGQYYHIYNRGAFRETIFVELRMYDMFLNYLHQSAAACGISVIAVCLMPNHFHLLVQVERGGNIPAFMHRLCWSYSRRINSILRRSGTIFQGRYRVKHVPDEAYFRQLCKYIHRNPVASALVESPLDWPYSNYMECLGLRRRISCDHEQITRLFSGEDGYRRYIEDLITGSRIRDRQLEADLVEMRAL